MNIDTLYLQFSADVSASLSADDVRLVGTSAGTYAVDLVAYEAVTDTAEFRIINDVNIDSFVFSILDGAVANAAGAMLDGEWTSEQAGDSGDGTPGGQFDFFFNVLVGDEDGSRQINTTDALNISESNTHAVDRTNFRRDINGSGQINSVDAFAAVANSSNGLPASPAVPSASYGDDFQSATAINTPVRLTGTLESFEDEHWFSFDTVAGQQYVFETPVDLDAELTLYDTDGTTVLTSRSYGGELSWFAPDDGKYYLSLTARVDGTPISYYLLGHARYADSAIRFDANDYYTDGIVGFEVNDANGFVSGATVLLESSSGDAETITIASNGVVFSSSISAAEGTANSGDGVLQVSEGDTITATYVDSDDGFGSTSAASDSATMVVDDRGDDAASALMLNYLPTNFSGTIEVPGDADWYSFSANAGTTYRFDLWFSGGLGLTVYDSDGTTQLEQSSLDLPWVAFDAPSDGTYYLSVSGLNPTASRSYQISNEIYVDNVGDNAAAATPLNVPGSTSGSIDFADDEDWFSFNVTAGTTLHFEVPSQDYRSEIILYDTDGTTQLIRDDSSSSPSFTVSLPNDGTYYLSIKNYSSSNTNNYTLMASVIEDIHGDDAASATALALPASISSSIEITGDADWFSFTAIAGADYIFEIPVNDLHRLTLYDADGITSLVQDDSSDPYVGKHQTTGLISFRLRTSLPMPKP